MKSTRVALVTILVAVSASIAQSTAVASGSTASSPLGSAVSAAAVTPALSSVTLPVTDVVGGNPVTGTVHLTSAAPAGGVLVPLTSDNPVAATVPPSVTVPAGSSSGTFIVSTLPLTNPQSALIIGTAGGSTAYAIITVRPLSQFSTGSIAIIPGGNGSGTITSRPAGIRCVITAGNGTGTCSAFFPVGTVVRLSAKAASGSKFQGWRGLPGCSDPSKITVARGTTINCQPSLSLK